MWFMGHAALGLLLALPLARRVRGGPGRDPLGLTPALILAVLLAANLPDALHFANLRPWTHNLAIGTGLSAVLAAILRRPMGLGRWDMAAVVSAGFAHPIGDMGFAEYHPLFPFDPGSVFDGPILWNSTEDLLAEAVLVAIVLAVLVHPRLAGRQLWGPWPGRDALLVRLAAWGLLGLLGATLAVFLLMNFLGGYDRSPIAIILFAEGIAIGVPFVGLAVSRRASRGGGRVRASRAAERADGGGR